MFTDSETKNEKISDMEIELKIIRKSRKVENRREKMMAGSVLLFILCFSLFTFSSCEQDDDLDGSTGDAVCFTAGIEAITRTSGGGDAWVLNDQVGIFMLTTDGSLATPTHVLADNQQYNVSNASTGALSPNGTPIYYPQSGNVDFIAYYPYGTVANGIYTLSVAGQTSEAAQNALDVLYAKTTDVAKTKTEVSLSFSHVLSKVTLNVSHGTGFVSGDISDLTSADLVFGGMPLTASLDLQNGTLTAGATGTFSPVKAATSAADATFTALLIPQATGGTGRTVVFTVDGSDYTWTIDNGDAFLAGNHYTYPVTLKKTGVEIGEPTITDWITRPNGSADLSVSAVRIRAAGKTFLMGSSDGTASGSGSPGDLNYTAAEPDRSITDETQHKVTFTEDFFISKYQITNAQYAAFLNVKGVVYETNISNTWISGDGGKCTWGDNNGQIMVLIHNWGVTYADGAWKAQEGYANYPVTNVTWYGAYEYAVWAGGSLPTEAQWEFACRGGKENHPFGIGDGTKLTYEMANFYTYHPYDVAQNGEYNDDSGMGYVNKTTAVGTYPYSNGYGLYDMHGNVFEWCNDWYGQYYGAADANALIQGVTTDPIGPVTATERVLRGGSWSINAQGCRSASRSGDDPGFADDFCGFRVVFPVP